VPIYLRPDEAPATTATPDATLFGPLKGGEASYFALTFAESSYITATKTREVGRGGVLRLTLGRVRILVSDLSSKSAKQRK